MSQNDKLFNSLIWGEKTEITDDLVDFYRKNPRELDLIIDKEYFHGKYIKLFFFLGVAITIVSRTLKFLFEDAAASFINDVVLDIISEFGIAIFGGAITTFLLEKLNQKQYEQNIAYRKEILERIKQLQVSTSQGS